MPRGRFLFALALATFAWAAPARAVQPDEMLPDPALEARARNLSRELRCMVCQNQSIDDSDAPLARDLRILVRDRLKAGADDRQVLDFLTARYGDFVLLKPRVSWRTAALWGTPAALLLFGGLGLVLFLRRRAPAAAAAPGLTPAEQQRVEDILRQEG
jgi:cytochrome c-type biogenesis protein CcmH